MRASPRTRLARDAHGPSCNGTRSVIVRVPSGSGASMLTKHFYVRIRRDRIDVRCVETNRNATRASAAGFSTSRLLVGTFTEADALL